jgi:hypothetical protein
MDPKFWVDPTTGELQEADDDTAERYGLRPATDDDLIAFHEGRANAAADTKGALGNIAEGLQRGLGHYVDAPNAIATGLIGDRGADAGLVEETPRTTGADLFPEAFSEEARRRAELHPVLQGIGTGLASAPLAAAGGGVGMAAARGLGAAVPALGGLATPIGALGGAAAGGMLGEAAVEAVVQEYDDAWLEQRPMQLGKIAANIAMFGVGDVLLRGAMHNVVSPILRGARDAVTEPKRLALGGRNLVAEAQAKAGSRAARPAQSVGAASASEMSEPFDDAIATMQPRDAIVMARDADDHYHLVARDAADEITRIYQGLTDSLGNQLKHEDVQIIMDGLDEKTLARQAQWADLVVDALRETSAEIQMGGPKGIKLGKAGKSLAADMDQYADFIKNAQSPAERWRAIDDIKRILDRGTQQVAGDYRADPTAQRELLKSLEGLVGIQNLKGGLLRQGLENTKYWGPAGDLQKALNAPWHEMLKAWKMFQETFLKATGEVSFGQTGAGRVVKESTAEQVLGVIRKDPRVLMDLAKHVGRVFEGYQRLIEARQAHGIVGKEGLEGLDNSIRNLMEDWNLAATVTTAVNKAKNASKDPRNWVGLGLDVAEKLPVVGGAVGAARRVGESVGDLHIKPGTPLADVWQRGLERFARHPSIQDPSIYAQYSPWMQEALRARGAPIPPAGVAPSSWAAEAGSKVAGAGLIGAGAGMAANQSREPQDPNAPKQAGFGPAGLMAAGLAMLLGKGGRKLIREEAAPLIGVLARQEGKDDWTHARVRQWLKGTQPLTVSDIEAHTVKPTLRWNKETGLYDDLNAGARNGELRAFVEEAMARTGASEDQVLREVLSTGTGFRPKAPRDPSAPAKPRKAKPAPEAAAEVPDRTGIEGEFDDIADELRAPPDVKDALSTMRAKVSREERAAMKAYQSAAGYKMNEALRTGDYSSMASERAADVEAALRSAIESGATAPGFVLRGIELSADDVQALTQAKVLTAQAFMSTSPNPQLAKRFANAGKMKRVQGHGWRKPTGDVPVLFEVEQATGVPLSAGEILLRPGTQFKVLAHRVERRGTKTEPRIVHIFRVRESGYRPGAKSDGIIAGGLIGLGALGAASEARAQEPSPRTLEPDPAPPDEQGPTALYRGALRSVDEGTDAIVRDTASAALRMKPPRGRPTLRAFTGRRSLDAAVDDARRALERLGQDPEALVDALAGSVGELGRTHPSVYSALVQKAAGIVSYLSAEVPARVGRTLLDPEGMAPSADRSLAFAYKVVGALMPRQAMADVARVDIAPEELEAFQRSWPELWEPLRAELIGQVQRRYEAGRRLDSEKLRQLDSMLGMNGLLDPSGSAEVAAHVISAADAAAQAPAQNSPPSKSPSVTGRASGMFRTRLEASSKENAVG